MTFYLFLAVIALNIPTYVLFYRTFFSDFWRWWGEQNRRWPARKSIGIHVWLFVISSTSVTLASYFVIAKFLFGFDDPWEFLRN